MDPTRRPRRSNLPVEKLVSRRAVAGHFVIGTSVLSDVGLLDGVVSWKGIRQMRRYRGSQIWGADGCHRYW